MNARAHEYSLQDRLKYLRSYGLQGYEQMLL